MHNTTSFHPANNIFNSVEEEEEEEEEEDNEDEKNKDDEMQGQHLNELLHMLEIETEDSDSSQKDATMMGDLPKQINLEYTKQKGTFKCGYELLAHMSMTQEYVESDNAEPQRSPSQQNIVSLLITRTTRRRRTFQQITKRTELVNVLEANGSVVSIIDWAQKAKIDRAQRSAMEVILGTFILTFYRDAPEHEFRVPGLQHSFITKKRLEDLVEIHKRRTNHLICFLHGDGGSGKTT
eukprot:scaffold70814_cov54-Attheya_sp.AAC.1